MPPPYPTSGLTDSMPVSASFGQGQTSNPCSETVELSKIELQQLLHRIRPVHDPPFPG